MFHWKKKNAEEGLDVYIPHWVNAPIKCFLSNSFSWEFSLKIVCNDVWVLPKKMPFFDVMGLRQQVNIDLAKKIYQRFLLSNVTGSQSPRNSSATENSADELLAV